MLRKCRQRMESSSPTPLANTLRPRRRGLALPKPRGSALGRQRRPTPRPPPSKYSQVGPWALGKKRYSFVSAAGSDPKFLPCLAPSPLSCNAKSRIINIRRNRMAMMEQTGSRGRPRGAQDRRATSLRVTPTCLELWDRLAATEGLSRTGYLETTIRRLAAREESQNGSRGALGTDHAGGDGRAYRRNLGHARRRCGVGLTYEYLHARAMW